MKTCTGSPTVRSDHGTFYVAHKPTTRAVLQKIATELGVSFDSTATAPTGQMAQLRRPRIGLVDHVGGGMPVGWTRLIFKNFEVPYVEDEDDVFPPDLNAGNLKAKYDVLIFNEEPLGVGGGGGRGGGGGGGDAPTTGDAAAGRGARRRPPAPRLPLRAAVAVVVAAERRAFERLATTGRRRCRSLKSTRSAAGVLTPTVSPR